MDRLHYTAKIFSDTNVLYTLITDQNEATKHKAAYLDIRKPSRDSTHLT